MKKLWLKLKLWYIGYVDVDSTLHDPNATDPHFTMTIHPQSRLRYFIRFLTAFWKREWKWIIGTILMALGVLAAFLALFR